MKTQASPAISPAQTFERFLYRKEILIRKVACFFIAAPIAILILVAKLLFPGNDGVGFLIIFILPFIAIVFGLHLILVVASWPMLLLSSVRNDPEISNTSLPNTLGRMHSLIVAALLLGSNLMH